MTSARQEGHNGIRALAVCHYTLYLHETQKPGVAGHVAEPQGGEDAAVRVDSHNQTLLKITGLPGL